MKSRRYAHASYSLGGLKLSWLPHLLLSAVFLLSLSAPYLHIHAEHDAEVHTSHSQGTCSFCAAHIVILPAIGRTTLPPLSSRSVDWTAEFHRVQPRFRSVDTMLARAPPAPHLSLTL